MPYTSLGLVTVTHEWQSFQLSVIGSGLIQLLQSTPLANNYCAGYLAQYFPLPSPGGTASPWKRIYSTPNPQLIQMPIPPVFEEGGFIVWTLQIKARYPYGFVSPWIVEARAYYPDPPPS